MPKVYVVSEAAVAKHMIDLVGSEVLQKIGPVGSITRAYVRRRHVGVVEKEEKRVPVDASGFEIGTAQEDAWIPPYSVPCPSLSVTSHHSHQNFSHSNHG